MNNNLYKQRVNACSLVFIGLIFAAWSPACSIAPENKYLTSKNVSNIMKFQEWKLKYINAISWASDSNTFVVAGTDSDTSDAPSLYMYNVNTSQPLWSTITIGGGSVDFHPDNGVVAVPYYEGVEFFDATSGQKKEQIDHDTKSVGSTCIGRDEIKFTPDGSKIITLSTDWENGTTFINIWDAESGKCLGEPVKEVGTAFDFELSSDGQFIAIGIPNALSDDPQVLEPQIHVWNIRSKELICKIKNSLPAAFTLDGNMIASGSIANPGSLDLWDGKKCQFLVTLLSKETSLLSVDFSPDGQLLAIGRMDTFEIWDISNQELLFVSEKLPNSVSTILFSPDGKHLLSKTDRTSREDKATIALWSIEK